MITGVLVGPIERALETYEFFKDQIDLCEIRLDTFSGDIVSNAKQLMQVITLPTILTLRSVEQGGFYDGSAEELIKLAKLKPAYLDVESGIDPKILEKIDPSVAKICSYHNRTQTPSDLEALLGQMKNIKAEIYKIAVYANSTLDALDLIRFSMAHPDLVAISMGEFGQISRIVSPVMANPLHYVGLDEVAAPGMLTFGELEGTYQFSSLNEKTKLLGLIGFPVTQSLSHITHNQVLRELGYNAVYLKMPIKPEEMDRFLDYASELPFIGLSVTMPLKKHFGFEPINTLTRTPREWKKSNTDGIGALNALEKRGPLAGKKMAILGTGGAAHAIAKEAIKRGCIVKIYGRNREKMEELSLMLSCESAFISDFIPDYQILVNTTPVGMFDEELPIAENLIVNQSLVFDAIPSPKETPLIKKALSKECAVVYGYEMFVQQALGQFQAWFGKNVPVKQVEEIISSVALRMFS